MTSAYSPHGAALLDYFSGNTAATLICEQDGVRDDVPVSFWFRNVTDPIERMALDLSRGRVLDVGAGTGVHTLVLQRRGLDVTAIDIEPACVEIMRQRGVTGAVLADLHTFDAGPFDTIFCLCNGLDKVGRLADLPRFLDRMAALLAPGGQLLADSFDLRVGAAGPRLEALVRKQSTGRYFGEMDLVFEYDGRRGDPSIVLHVDPVTLADTATAGGWTTEIPRQDGGHYLARLTRR
jgi:SAM-dependent methyltransferase